VTATSSASPLDSASEHDAPLEQHPLHRLVLQKRTVERIRMTFGAAEADHKSARRDVPFRRRGEARGDAGPAWQPEQPFAAKSGPSPSAESVEAGAGTQSRSNSACQAKPPFAGRASRRREAGGRRRCRDSEGCEKNSHVTRT
jgi:hypothetical protein